MALEWHGDKAQQVLRTTGRQGLFKAANHLKERAVERTPLDTGALRNSARASADGSEAAVAFGFGEAADYAVRQHEELGWKHTDGQAKYLERAMIAERERIAQVLATELRRALS